MEHDGILNKPLISLLDDNNLKVIEIGDNNVSAGQGER